MGFLIQFLLERGSCQFRRLRNQRRKQIRVVIRDHSLQHRGHSLQAHARIDRWLGQRIQLPAGVAVELHEDEIPQLDIASAVAAEFAVGVALIGRDHTHVVMNLAARTAGAGVAHLPEIVFQTELEDAVFRYALADPQVVSFGVARHAAFAVEDGHVQLVLVDAEPLRRGDQFPGVGDGVFLEVVAEGKISQHLEKRVMTVGEADIFEIVVLAAGAHAFLGGCGAGVVAFFQSEEDVLELVHACVGEQQGGIVLRDERR